MFYEPLEERSLLATIMVTSLADGTLASLAGDGKISLREAIEAANTNQSVDGSATGQAAPAMDTIVFASGLSGRISLGVDGQFTVTETVKIQGNGAAKTIIDAHGTSRVFEILASGGDVTLDGMTIMGGNVAGVSPNAALGGGILSLSTGLLSVIGSTISGNSVTTSGNDSFSQGGGIWANDAIMLANSTISGNSVATNGDRNFAEGGGIFSYGEVTITSSTISGNSVAEVGSANTAEGGGIRAGGAVTVIGSTITQNRVSGDTSDGGGVSTFDDPAILRNSIVAGNTDNDGSHPDLRIGDDTSALLVAQASLIGDNNGTSLTAAPAGVPDANGNLIGTHAAPIDPKLAPLADNGGPTQTMALLPGSPAIDAGDNNLAKDPGSNGIPGDNDDVALTTDQRGSGFARLVNARRDQAAATVDMGAYEYNSLLVTTSDDELDATYDAADLSLREALAISNSTPIDSILFASPAVIGPTITLSLGELVVSSSVKIEGPGANALAISGGSGATQSRVFDFAGSGVNTYRLRGVTVRDGNGAGTSPGFGGAIRFVGSDDKLVITDSVIRDSTATTGGTDGGGLFADLGTLELTNMTVMNNTAAFGGGLAFLEVHGTLTNVTISGNTATTRGGGIVQFSNRVNGTSELLILNSTIVGNISTIAAGIRNSTQNGGVASKVTLGNTIVANNTGGGVQLANAAVAGTSATIVSLGNNITSDASGNLTGPGDLQNKDPGLAPLAVYDGTIPTHALCNGVDLPVAGCTALSPAIDAGDNALAKTAGPDGVWGNADDVPLVTDGRGMPFQRIVNGTVDIGAFEYFVNTPPTCTILAPPAMDDEQGLITIPNFVSNCSANDLLQTVRFSLQPPIDYELFTVGPYLDEAGTLIFDPKPNVHGIVKLTIGISDDGGMFAGGDSYAEPFELTAVVKKHRLFNAAEEGARRGLDVTGSTSVEPDGFIVAQDVVAVINYINAHGSGPIPADSPYGPPYVDVTGPDGTGDNNVVAEDVLKIINWINAHPGQQEGAAGQGIGVGSQEEDLLLMLAEDVAGQPRRGRIL